MAVVIFDLFGTLIEKVAYDYDSALDRLAVQYFDGRVGELAKLSLLFKKGYIQKRKDSLAETSFFAQLEFFETSLEIRLQEDRQAVELAFLRDFRKERLIDGAEDVLRYLHEGGCQLFVLTNSIFSGDSLRAYLDGFGIGRYFREVYSSADIGFRKPSRRAFSYVLANLRSHTQEEVYYVGDSMEKDYEGARKSGLTAVLFGTDPRATGMAFGDMGSLLSFFQARLGSSAFENRRT